MTTTITPEALERAVETFGSVYFRDWAQRAEDGPGGPAEYYRERFRPALLAALPELLAAQPAHAWPERYGCNGPEGTFWTDDAALANKLIAGAFDRDDWTVTDMRNPVAAQPAMLAMFNEVPMDRDIAEIVSKNYTKYLDDVPAQPASSAGGQEPIAFCDLSDPRNDHAFAWPGSDRQARHTAPLYAAPVAGEAAQPVMPVDDHAVEIVAGALAASGWATGGDDSEFIEDVRDALNLITSAPAAVPQVFHRLPEGWALSKRATCYQLTHGNDVIGNFVGAHAEENAALVARVIDSPAIRQDAPPTSAAVRPSDDALWDKTLRDRDRYHEVADDLAGHIARITGIDIGEHTSANCPWQNAIEAAEGYAAPPAPTAVPVDGADMVALEVARRFTPDSEPQRRARLQTAIVTAIAVANTDHIPVGYTLVGDDELARLRERAEIPLRIDMKEVWFWQGDGYDYPESLSCPVIMHADALRALLTGKPAAQGVDLRPGIEAAAKLIRQKADDYAEQFGHDDMGGLSFGSGQHAEVKSDHHYFMLELVDELHDLIDSQHQQKESGA